MFQRIGRCSRLPPHVLRTSLLRNARGRSPRLCFWFRVRICCSVVVEIVVAKRDLVYLRLQSLEVDDDRKGDVTRDRKILGRRMWTGWDDCQDDAESLRGEGRIMAIECVYRRMARSWTRGVRVVQCPGSASQSQTDTTSVSPKRLRWWLRYG
nr:hypothetical protein CFP56_79429 [Quercus suber]